MIKYIKNKLEATKESQEHLSKITFNSDKDLLEN